MDFNQALLSTALILLDHHTYYYLERPGLSPEEIKLLRHRCNARSFLMAMILVTVAIIL